MFALWAFWMLNKTVRASTKTSLPVPETPGDQKQKPNQEEADFEGDDLVPQGDTKRVDHLQYLVKKNPEMTAAIISQWVQEAK